MELHVALRAIEHRTTVWTLDEAFNTAYCADLFCLLPEWACARHTFTATFSSAAT